uniref:NF4 n=1 Tax=synthetic construct TaxID=32630 RepID=UPI001AA00D14|nr:Chain A, NF4 [synthetic construct]
GSEEIRELVRKIYETVRKENPNVKILIFIIFTSDGTIKVIIVIIADDPNDAKRIVKKIQERFPKLTIKQSRNEEEAEKRIQKELEERNPNAEIQVVRSEDELKEILDKLDEKKGSWSLEHHHHHH